MKTLLAFIASPTLGECGLKILKTFLAWMLLIATMAFPAAAWHRIWLKIPGWYWWPAGFVVGIYATFISYLFHQNAWLLLALPIPLLFAHDCFLVISSIWSKKP